VSASGSGTLLLPMTPAVVVASQVAGRVSSRTGRYRIFPLAGALCLAAGCAVLATVHPGTPVWLASGALVLIGAGLGALLTAGGADRPAAEALATAMPHIFTVAAVAGALAAVAAWRIQETPLRPTVQ
jgi:MFS family permease